jgi:hypothetical protein
VPADTESNKSRPATSFKVDDASYKSSGKSVEVSALLDESSALPNISEDSSFHTGRISVTDEPSCQASASLASEPTLVKAGMLPSVPLAAGQRTDCTDWTNRTSGYNMENILATPTKGTTRYERLRDALLRVLISKTFAVMGVVYIIFVIGDGAFFFFLMMGWHANPPFGGCDDPCSAERAQDVANWWYNLSLQILCGLFTWGALMDTPWRIANAVHLSDEHRSQEGIDFHGRPTDLLWFCMERRDRIVLICLLFGNLASQFANQATRIVYPSFESTSTFPGNLWVNVFFVFAFVFAIAAGIYQGRCEGKLIKRDPERFWEQDKIRIIKQVVAAGWERFVSWVNMNVHANEKLIGRCLIFWGIFIFLLVLDFVITVVIFHARGGKPLFVTYIDDFGKVVTSG